MEYERIKLDNIHPQIKKWISDYLETNEYWIVDSIHEIGTNEFQYLIIMAEDETDIFKLTMAVEENGKYDIKRASKPFEKLSLTND